MPRRTNYALFCAAAAVLACFAGAGPALAWGKTGHRITGEIAERHLSGQARARITVLLGGQSLAEASTWVDEMRADPDRFWQKTALPWHFVTVPGETYSPGDAPAKGDALTALRRFERTLLSRSASLQDKQLALRFIVHIIGDLHQPLHAGNGSDRGGNDVQVTFFGRPTNLHSVWDSGLINQEELSFTEHADRLMRRTDNQELLAWWEPNPLDWVDESAGVREEVYPEQTNLGYDYVYRSKPLLERRLQQAGVRMAAYLSDLFSKAPTGSSDRPRGQLER